MRWFRLLRWPSAPAAAPALGGSEARCTNEAVMEALKQGLGRSAVAPDALTLLTTRQESLALLRLDGLVI